MKKDRIISLRVIIFIRVLSGNIGRGFWWDRGISWEEERVWAWVWITRGGRVS